MSETIIQNVRFDDSGLIPAVIQDAETNEIIALYYMDNMSLAATLKTGKTMFSIPNLTGPEDQRSYKLVDVRVNADEKSLTVLIERETGQKRDEKSVSLLGDLSGREKKP